MAQATNPRIEELRFRLKTDPKSRLFYQLAEELRRVSVYEEAERVLRSGLEVYPTYLAAWVSLGRVLRERKQEREAVDALGRALQLDPGNAVAARLMADAWLALGEKVEAIKKYKLVQALLPSDDTLRAVIDQLERELAPPSPVPLAAEPQPPVDEVPLADVIEHPLRFSRSARGADERESTSPADEPNEGWAQGPYASGHEPDVRALSKAEARAPSEHAVTRPLIVAALFAASEAEAPGDATEEPPVDSSPWTGDEEPMRIAHEESPFEQPVEGFTAATLEVEAPSGFTVETAPFEDELGTPAGFESEDDSSDDQYGDELEPLAAGTRDAAYTPTMAGLYAKQGLVDDAATIYESILAREPGNEQVRGKLGELKPGKDAKILKLEQWLSRIAKREVPRV